MSRIRAIVSIAVLALMVMFPVSATAGETPPEPAATSTAKHCQTDMSPVKPRCLTLKEISLRARGLPLDTGPSVEELHEQRVKDLTLQRDTLGSALLGVSIGCIILAMALAMALAKNAPPSAPTQM